uniref:Uncharacterized protein n=1 Tax=Oryza barthii TaxID=65489 RepID=A0A0D3GMU7_9ORYZ
MEMPKDAALPSRTMQRHRGSDWTTPASVVQQVNSGIGDLPEMHGESVIITLEQPLFCDVAREASIVITTTITATTGARGTPVCDFLAAIVSCRSMVPPSFPPSSSTTNNTMPVKSRTD